MIGESIRKEIYCDLISELDLDDFSSKRQLEIKVKGAIREVASRRNYPSHFSESEIEKDLERLYANIKNLALYDYNQIGVEGQTTHSENGESRAWKDREECLKGVFAWAGF